MFFDNTATTDIITAIKPLYEDLSNQGFTAFVKENDFVRLCNNLGLSAEYTHAYNEEAAEFGKKTQNDILASFNGLNYENVLARFLNKLYTNRGQDIANIIVSLLEAYLEYTAGYFEIDNIIKDLRFLKVSSTDELRLDAAWRKYDQNGLRYVLLIRNHALGRAASGTYDDKEYAKLRVALLRKPGIKEILPDYIKTCTTTDDFWQFIKPMFPSYAERRNYIRDTFAPLIEKLETSSISIIEDAVVINDSYISAVWQKALQRLKEDPEAAITSARTLLETVCKHILDVTSSVYDDTMDLPKLYKTTAAKLNLSPEQHTEQIFKQILTGCSSVVDGLGSMRNKLSDAHGKSQRRVKPSSRHAALAVNLSGAMCQFLLETYEVQRQSQNS